MGSEDMTDTRSLCAGDDCRIRDDCRRFAVAQSIAVRMRCLAPGAIWVLPRPDDEDDCDMYLPLVPRAGGPVQLELF